MSNIKGYWEQLRTYGAIKVTLVTICFMILGASLFFVVGTYLHNFWERIAYTCESNFPYLTACKDLSDVSLTIVQFLLAITSSAAFSYNLLKRSLTAIVTIIILIFIISLLGILDIKRRYETTSN